MQVIESIDMHHYFDAEFDLWVTHWVTEEFECCTTCCTDGKTLHFDEFETPRFPDQVPLEIWQTRMKHKPTKGDNHGAP